MNTRDDEYDYLFKGEYQFTATHYFISYYAGNGRRANSRSMTFDARNCQLPDDRAILAGQVNYRINFVSIVVIFHELDSPNSL